jgi:pyridine nucleotide-disulfide oxidoreductase family protein
VKRLILVGGGHCHIEVLRYLAAHPEPGLETWLLTPDRHLLYSGMIPGVVARDYEISQCRIDLDALARHASARLVLAEATGINADGQQVLTVDGQTLDYDIASLDVGSMPAATVVMGVLEHAIPLRPAARFLSFLQDLDARARGGGSCRIAVVGAGAAGVEIGLTLASRIRHGANEARVAIVSDSPELLPGLDRNTRLKAEEILRSRNIGQCLGSKVSSVDARGLTLAEGRRIDADAVIWATGAAALPWLGADSLAIDAAGFVSIDDCLRSVSHPEVFAAGDCATNLRDPRPKSGVMAVRQAPLLAANLLRAARGESLLAFKSSPAALAILNCGGRQALASWRGQALHGKWVWHWKDWLDRRFVRRYSGLS